MKKLLILCVILAAIHTDVSLAAPSLANDRVIATGYALLPLTPMLSSFMTIHRESSSTVVVRNDNKDMKIFRWVDGTPLFSYDINGTGFSLRSLGDTSKIAPNQAFGFSIENMDFTPSFAGSTIKYNILDIYEPITIHSDIASSSLSYAIWGDPFNLFLTFMPGNQSSFYIDAKFNTEATTDPAVAFHYFRDKLTGNITAIEPAPVPVPASIWLFGSAISAAGLSFRKKQMQAA